MCKCRGKCTCTYIFIIQPKLLNTSIHYSAKIIKYKYLFILGLLYFPVDDLVFPH